MLAPLNTMKRLSKDFFCRFCRFFCPFFCKFEGEKFFGFFRIGILFVALAFSSCASDRAKVKPQEAIHDPNDPLSSLNIDPNQTLSEKKLIEILRRQKLFFDRIDAGSKMSAHDVITEKRRIASLWDEYLINNQKDVNALILYGKFCRTVGDAARAYSAFAQADSLDPSIGIVKQQMAAYEAETGLYEQAMSHMKDAIELSPKSSIYHLQYAQIIMLFREEMVASGKFKQSELDDLMIKSYASAVKLEPRNAALRREYALAFYELGKADWNEALAQWKTILGSCATYSEKQLAQLNIARVLMELHRDDEAEKVLALIDEDSLVPQKLLLMGEINRAKTETKKSEEHKSKTKE